MAEPQREDFEQVAHRTDWCECAKKNPHAIAAKHSRRDSTKDKVSVSRMTKPKAAAIDKDTKARAWTFLIYPESSAPDWMEQLELTHLPVIVSPLHDRDEWTDADERKNPNHKAGTLKKPHHHVMIIFNGGARLNQALTALRALKIKYAEPVQDVRVLTRYFCHLDNQNKAQYLLSDMQALNGASISIERVLSAEERNEIRSAALGFIRENSITEYADLIDYCMDCEPDWLQVVATQTHFFTGYLASVRGKEKARQEALAALHTDKKSENE